MTDREVCFETLYDIHINGVLCHKALKSSLDRCDKSSEKLNKAFIARVVSGVTEKYYTLTKVIEFQSGRGISKIKPGIRVILAMGIYQGYFMSVPVSAACNEAVKLAKAHNLAGLSGFVNGVLRNIFRTYPKFEDVLVNLKKNKTELEQLSLDFSCPEWLVERFINDFGPEKTKEMFEDFLVEKPVGVYRVKTKISSDELEELFEKYNIEYEIRNECEGAYLISNPGKLTSSPVFKKGYVLIQDISSMMAGEIIPVEKIGENAADKPVRILDLCAAPGGKTLHVCDRFLKSGKLFELTARDVSDSKIDLIKENMKRTGLTMINTEVGDASVYNEKDIEKYELVIADLPCSGLGVIGRKSDIKYKTKSEDIKALAELQKSILNRAVKYVKPNGYLIFSTCTLASEENEENAKYIIDNGFTSVKIDEKLDKSMKYYLQSECYLKILPTINHDGFFAAVFQKKG